MRVIDSHTAGEPTRTIIEGGPDLGAGTLAKRAALFEAEHGWVRPALLTEPRGFDAMVGALLCEPDDPDCATGVIFFNTVDNLGMCGHGMIGLAVTLADRGRIAPGRQRIQTPVGLVTVDLHDRHRASVENVESYRYASAVTVDVDGLGPVTGDIAWGGNWFFLCEGAPAPLVPANIPALTAAATGVRQALEATGITGADGGEIDHIEFFGPAGAPDADSRNFVLCPGGAYDRSPCGTGTSAKLACLAADGKLKPGETWVQESVIGSRYQAVYRAGANGSVIPTITGEAFVVGETLLRFEEGDPYRVGFG